MRFPPRPIASFGVLAVAAAVATGLMLGPTAYAAAHGVRASV
ncbi:hypothetical protein [Actinomadura sp. 9N215]